MRILVTGGAGFIGSHIVDTYLAAGHTVAIVDNLSTGRREHVNPRARLYTVDLGAPDALAEVFAREQPQVVSHQAAQKSVRLSVEDPAADATINIVGSLHLLEQCRRHGVEQVIFASTGGAIYGDVNVIPTPEDHAAWPVSPYGIAKLTVEHYLYFYHHQSRPLLHRAALRECLRPAPGPARRGGRGGDLRRAPPRGGFR